MYLPAAKDLEGALDNDGFSMIDIASWKSLFFFFLPNLAMPYFERSVSLLYLMK